MSLLHDDHANRGTLILVEVPWADMAALADDVTRADVKGAPLRLALEIDPDASDTAALKTKIGEGTWTLPLPRPVTLTIQPMLDPKEG